MSLDHASLQRQLAYGGLALATASVLALAVANGSTEWFRSSEAAGRNLGRLWDASLVLLPLSILLFAGGVQWLVERRWVAAALALPALPAWVLAFLLHDSMLAKNAFTLLVVLQLQGIDPFGSPA